MDPSVLSNRDGDLDFLNFLYVSGLIFDLHTSEFRLLTPFLFAFKVVILLSGLTASDLHPTLSVLEPTCLVSSNESMIFFV